MLLFTSMIVAGRVTSIGQSHCQCLKEFGSFRPMSSMCEPSPESPDMTHELPSSLLMVDGLTSRWGKKKTSHWTFWAVDQLVYFKAMSCRDPLVEAVDSGRQMTSRVPCVEDGRSYNKQSELVMLVFALCPKAIVTPSEVSIGHQTRNVEPREHQHI